MYNLYLVKLSVYLPLSCEESALKLYYFWRKAMIEWGLPGKSTLEQLHHSTGGLYILIKCGGARL